MGASDGAVTVRPAIPTWEHGLRRPPNVRGGSTMSYVGGFPEKAEALVASKSVFAGWATDADV